jgi:hypothetical protein
MGARRRRQGTSAPQSIDNKIKPLAIVAASRDAPEVLPESSTESKDLHAFRLLRGGTILSKISIVLPWKVSPPPASNSSIAFLVSRFGKRASNGNPSSKTTCRKNIVIAAVVLTPRFASTRPARALSFGSIRAVMYAVLPMRIGLNFCMFPDGQVMQHPITNREGSEIATLVLRAARYWMWCEPRVGHRRKEGGA